MSIGKSDKHGRDGHFVGAVGLSERLYAALLREVHVELNLIARRVADRREIPIAMETVEHFDMDAAVELLSAHDIWPAYDEMELDVVLE